MATFLNIFDLAFLLAQVKAGSKPPAGTDPLSLIGLRAIDGTHNNLTHQVILDQYGNEVDTDTFGNVDLPFFHIVKQDPLSPALDNSYAPLAGQLAPLVDSSPRIISNLVADMSANNPAFVAVEASSRPATGNPGSPTFFVPPTNSLFTFFGQFFDHGLDFISKGGSGTVTITLPPGDPLLSDPLLQFGAMFLDRASLTPVIDPDTGLQITDPVTGELLWNTNNSTAPLVEQSQTYGQRASTTFYLMEYDDQGNATGRLVTHADGGMATWADIKANALKKGIVLTDLHVLDIPEPVLNPVTGLYSAGAGTGQAFLADIAHTANPSNPGYDAALLAAHKVAGDGRVNENTALTAIHEAFHSEHNRILLEIKNLIQQQDQVAPGTAAEWDGERLFQAAKLVNEMQYQHFVFEEFARRLSPNVDAFAQYAVTINPNISAEFSQAVYRLGHSMLTDTVRSQDASGNYDDRTLVESFLNPVLFDELGAAALVKGATQETMNEIDEFVVDGLRNMLVGLPLDLAALNIARGRDVGLATLNETRKYLFDQTQEGTLAPYTSWSNFGDNLLHPESLVNFIAAYARGGEPLGDAIVAARTLGDNAGARGAAQAILNAAANVNGPWTAQQIADAQAFLSGGNLGFWDIDLWIGGLAEAKAFGPTGVQGMLGTTFDFIFATQLVDLQNGDRFYYLARLGGTNILAEIEQSTFGDLFERGTGARHTNGDIFSTANEHVELSDLGVNVWTSPFASAVNWMEVVGGTTLADTINARGGNDTVWGEAGNDIINGGDGADHLYGNDGDDTINGGNQNDFIRGDAGNDTLNGDAGDDLIFGKTGNDILRGGSGFDLLEGGRGNDILEGGSQDDTLVGQENDDILRGGTGDDALDGGSGNDYLQGDAGVDTLLGFEGDDVLDGGAGADVLDGGLLGYDVATYASSQIGLTIDMANPAGSTGDATGDTFLNIEEVRGTRFNDGIIGDALNNVLVGGGGNDFLDGGLGDDVLYDNAGNLLDPNVGDDVLHGGVGLDQVVYLGRSSSDFVNPFTSINAQGDGILVETASGASDTLVGVELLAFDDGIWSNVLREWVPLVTLGVPNAGNPSVIDSEPTLTINDGSVGGVALDGNQVNSTIVLDNTVINPINGIYLADIVITDPDGISGGGGALRNVFLTGADAAAFIISPDGTELRFVGSAVPGVKRVNFEFQERYNVTVNVADASGSSAINYTLNITDVNDNAPVFTSPDHIVVGVDTLPDKVIYRATASDLDTVTNVDTNALGAPFAFSLPIGVADNNLFTMTNNGEVRPAGALTAGTYTLALLASDGLNSTPKNVTVTVSGTLLSDGIFTTNNDTVDLNSFNLNLYTQAAATDALAGNDTVTLSATQNIGVLFSGGAGNDTIVGSINADNIDGGDDNDFLNGGTGNDTINGGLGLDWAIFDGHYSGFSVTAFNDDGSIVYSDTNLADGDAGSDTLLGIERISNTLGGGLEVVLGTTGDETLQLSTGWYGIVNGGAGVDIVTGGNGNDWLGGGSGNDTINGGSGRDIIDGGADDDILNGDAGNDIINGGSGTDTINGGAHADTINGGAGNDDINGGSGFDWAVFEGHYTGFAVTAYNDDGSIVYTDINLADGDAGSDTLLGIERIANTLGGNWEVKLGTTGADSLSLSTGWYGIVNGGGGGDTVTGGNGNDWLGGGSGNDTINGGGGHDIIDGGADNDILNGNAGNDRFVFTAGWGQDTINDFNTNGEVIDLSALNTDFGSLTINSINSDTDTEIFITADPTNTITLLGVAAATISANDFDFV